MNIDLRDIDENFENEILKLRERFRETTTSKTVRIAIMAFLNYEG
jgi:hypothetical protein